MTERIPTLEELQNWSNDVMARREGGENISELEIKASAAIFEFTLMEAYKQNPLQIYNMVLKKSLEDLKNE